MAFDWTTLISPGMALGGSLAGNAIQSSASKADTKEQARQFDVRTQRADAARNMLMPNLQTNLGQRPSLGMMPGAPGAYPQYGGSGGSGGGSALGGIAKAGAGLAASKFLGMTGGPIGMAASFAPEAIKALKNIGAGRRAANRLTGAAGAQGQFGDIMKEVARRESEGQYTPEQRSQLLAQALDRQINAGMSQIKGDKDRLVMRQWLGDFLKPEWQAHPQLAQVATKYLGSLS